MTQRDGTNPARLRPGIDKAVDVIEAVWRNYRQYTGVQLSNATHVAGSPWSATRATGKDDAVIPDRLIADDFRKRNTAATAAAGALLDLSGSFHRSRFTNP